MRKQDHEIHGHELYNAFKRDPLENDWYILPLIVIVGIAISAWLAIQWFGADRFIEKTADYITEEQSLGHAGINGDMNEDGVLTTADLSILADELRKVGASVTPNTQCEEDKIDKDIINCTDGEKTVTFDKTRR